MSNLTAPVLIATSRLQCSEQLDPGLTIFGRRLRLVQADVLADMAMAAVAKAFALALPLCFGAAPAASFPVPSPMGPSPATVLGPPIWLAAPLAGRTGTPPSVLARL